MSIKDRFMKHVIIRTDSDCWSWAGNLRVDGRPTFSIKGKKYSAARISFEIHKGPFDKILHVCHKCDNPICTNPTHLFLGTAFDNMKDMTDKGRRAYGDKVANKGETNPSAKLTSKIIQEIRETYDKGGVSQQSLGMKYGISQVMVSKIVRKANWR